MRPTALLIALAALLALAAVAAAVLPQQGGTVDLRTQVDGKVRSNSTAEGVTGTVAGVGDFNGDGLGDMAMGVLENGGIATARVVFGINSPFEAQLNDDKQIAGAGGGVALTSARSISAIAGAGDVNGDGRRDLAIGSCGSVASDPGRGWVVFGRPGNATIDLDNLGTGGFVVNGTTGQCLGGDVDSAGNANGDAFPDVVFGTPKADSGNGGAVVVFGKTGPETVEVSALGTGGYTMLAPGDTDAAGTNVAGLGDVNGDGRADIGVGAPGHSPMTGAGAGAVWVVYGRVVTNATNIALGNVGPSNPDLGFRINGPFAGAALSPVAPAGDVNTDGKADIAVGAPFDDRSADNGGSVSVVYGKLDPNPVETNSLNDSGYQFRNAVAMDTFGASLRGGVDVNGDGLPDVIAGAPLADPNTLKDAGTVFALFGRLGTGTGAADDSLVPSDAANGFKITGPRAGIDGSQAPSSIGSGAALGVGDVNGDSRPDILAAVAAATVSGGTTDPGTAFVTIGFGTPAFRVPATYGFTATAPGTPVVPTDVKRTGNPTFSIAPALPAGLVLDAATGAVSGTPKEESSTQHTLTMTDLAGSTGRLIRIVIGVGPDVLPPVISRAKLTVKKFRVGARPTAREAAKKKAPFGTQLRMTVSEAVSMKITITCRGKLRGKFKKFCTKTLTTKKATFTRKVGKGGDTVFAFTGRVGSKLKLLPGKYSFTVVATDLVKLVSKPVSVKFEVVK